jgi:dephospho-CoA kinase
MFCVGLIGNLASGKSTVATYFGALGVDIISADNIAKELTTPNQPAFYEIARHFGKKILRDTGELNRKQLRDIIFNHPDERLWLEKLLHPLIRQQIQTKMQQTTSPYCIIEIPLLQERAQYPYLNRILLIETDRALQISRFIIRDNATKKDALSILSTQSEETELQKLANDILKNNGSLDEIKSSVRMLHEQYLKYAKGNRP